MGDPKFTPGPWQAGTMTMGSKEWASLGKGEIHIVRRGCDVIAAVWCGDDSEGEEEANAHLFAAAPRLYREVENVLRCSALPEAWAAPLRAVLAQARGEG